LAIRDRAHGQDAKFARAQSQPAASTQSAAGTPLPGAGDGVASDRARHIASGIRSLTLQNVVTSVLGFVFLSMLLRLLSPSDYGLYSAALLVTTIGSSVAVFGLQFAATRFVAFMAHDEGESRVVSRSIVVLSLVFTSVATVVYVLLSPTLSLYFTKSTNSAWIFAASGAWLFSLTMSGIFQALVQGMRRYQTLARILVSANVATVGLTVLGLLEFHSVIVPIAAWVVYGAVIIIWSLAITRRPLLLADSAGTGGRTVRQVLRYSIPLGIAGIVTVATGAADPIVVGGFLSEAQLGAYYAAIAISGGLGVMLFTPLNTAFFPETSSYANDPSKLSAGLRLAFRYTALALIPVSFALVGLSKQMIRLFAGGVSSYLVANPSLQMMSGFFLFVAMQGILTSLLLSTGKTTQVMLIGIVTVVLDLALSVLLVPSFGLLGAATSRTLVDIAGFLMALYLTRSYLRGIGDIWFQIKLVASSLVMLGVLFGMSKFISNRALTLIPYSLIGVAVLLLCARGLRLLTEEDKLYLEHFMPRSVSRVMRQLL
jgi:O-antigen/teichoic acid export membrane protein